MGVDTSSAQLFSQQLLEVLRTHPAGISEYELIRKLEAYDKTRFSSDCLRDNLSLFQTHFLLFHTLHRLRDELCAAGKARLEIAPLCIQLIPIQQQTDTMLSTHDPLRAYYLDLDNLNNTDANDVDALIGKFWQRFVTNGDRHEALAELELQDPVDWITIKTQHRRLAMKHHPDRGGDEQRLQAINAAMDILARDARNQR